MPNREGGYTRMELLSMVDRLAQDHEFQAHWYRHVAGLVAPGETVIDIGAGVGYGLGILRGTSPAQEVVGIDPLPAGPLVQPGTVEAIPDASYDWALCVDVIEHVEADRDLLQHLLRVARRRVFISTPNWNVSRAVNPFHVREYTPLELSELLAGLHYRVWVSDHACTICDRPQGIALDEPFANFAVLIEKE